MNSLLSFVQNMSQSGLKESSLDYMFVSGSSHHQLPKGGTGWNIQSIELSKGGWRWPCGCITNLLQRGTLQCWTPWAECALSPNNGGPSISLKAIWIVSTTHHESLALDSGLPQHSVLKHTNSWSICLNAFVCCRQTDSVLTGQIGSLFHLLKFN